MEIKITGTESPAILRMTAAFIAQLAELREEDFSGVGYPGSPGNRDCKNGASSLALFEGVVETAVAGAEAQVEAPAIVISAEVSEQAEAVAARFAKAAKTPAKAEQIPAATKAASLDDVRAALHTYSTKTSMAGAIELLKKHGAQRISDLTEDNRAAFIADCENA